MSKNTIPYENIIQEDLQDDEFAVMYLNEALKDPDPRFFLLAIRRVAKARNVQIGELAEGLKMERRTLYYALSEKGNPTWKTLYPLLSALGFEMQLLAKGA
jgi:probable addiction module antidote protein